MRTRWTYSLMTLLALMIGVGCSQTEPAAPASSTALPDLRPTATIKDIMNYLVDPSADSIWESVATVVDFNGIHEEFPETEEEWEAVRGDAMRIIEATNLLLIPGRRVTEAGVRSEFPGIELHPEEIQELIDQDWASFIEYAHGLHDMATLALEAIDARDVPALLASGEDLDVACERCHLHYWYPNDEAARELFEDNERLRQEALDSEGGQ